ncbi:MAG: zinc metallopeptidase [Finegoldia magna]|uniref:Peptidase n=1 Tax=Finegoldia magna TaxID=1260 RepID=A0A233V4Y5_FINMA|nr:zinc metallopeptidase [Finegoldia magna]MDU5223271.1 zinc metallopeptidase [Finegoldia magna]MDU5236784.1 zinc metallopeptidase [Finegoldia magna]OXZ27461.1 peptidase [Finegoldia magna]
MFNFYYDRTMLLLIPALILAFYSQIKVTHTFDKYKKITNSKGLTGKEMARVLLDYEGLSNIEIVNVQGSLTDYYDSSKKVLALSDAVYNSQSISAVSVASHEVGHAIQDKENYGFLRFRESLFPVVNFASKSVWILILLGFMFSMRPLVEFGIILFSVTVLFQLITLPVEFDASSRAIRALSNGLLTDDEIEPAKQVLKAAALTYIASALVSLLQLVRLILISRDRD